VSGSYFFLDVILYITTFLFLLLANVEMNFPISHPSSTLPSPFSSLYDPSLFFQMLCFSIGKTLVLSSFPFHIIRVVRFFQSSLFSGYIRFVQPTLPFCHRMGPPHPPHSPPISTSVFLFFDGSNSFLLSSFL